MQAPPRGTLRPAAARAEVKWMQEIRGTAASAGLALGPVKVLTRRYSALGRTVLEPRREAAVFEAAVDLAKSEIAALRGRAAGDDKAIFTFQREVLSDHGLLAEILHYIDAGAGAAAAVERAAGIYTAKMRSIPDEYLSQRACDIQDACRRVVDILDGRPRERLTIDAPCILVSDELLPSDIVSVDHSLLLGIVTAGGSAQSHASIIARTFGIPAVVLAGPQALAVPDGAPCALDGAGGLLVVEPDEPTYARYAHRINLAKRRRVSQERLRTTPCVSRDGVSISLLANCSGPADITHALELGADGVGLVRSEFLFLGGALPDEACQAAFYRDCVRAARGRPITIRTLDIGADKEVAGLTGTEPNPALGLRGLRFSLAHRDLFYTQLAALLKAGLEGPLKVMFPMVASVQDLERALAAVDEVRQMLSLRGEAFSKDVEFGIMIETPAAALMADELAVRAAFFSVGTNDLTQYTHAADRVNPAVEQYYTPASPAVLRLLRFVARSAADADIGVSVCGESAADPALALLYARAGIRSLSMAAPSIAEVKERLLDETISIG